MSSFKQSILQVKSEFEGNKRLQLMGIAILAILMLSLSKTFSDALNDKRSETTQQAQMVTKLNTAANRPLSQSKIAKAEEVKENLIAAVPAAGSASLAEAQALKLSNSVNGKLVTKGRTNLVGSDELNIGGETFWQVRVELIGQLPPKNMIKFMENFDGSLPYQRIATLQYRPKASNTLTVVIDYLFKHQT